MRKVVIAGGTGHLGSLVTEHFVNSNVKVVLLTRKLPPKGNPLVSYTLWDGKTLGEWSEVLESTDVVLNFSGKSVNCIYTKKNKEKLISSRVESTRILGEAIQRAENPPKIWINASSAAYYGFSDKPMDESAPAGTDFPAEICKNWENAFYNVNLDNTRRVALRLGVVLQRKKGLILPFVRLARFFLGGKQGSGEQQFSWIHEKDFIRSIQWFLENNTAIGSYNATAPEPICNKRFMGTLRDALGIPFGIPIPSFLIRLGGRVVGTEPDLVLKGRKVVPKRLLNEGFEFNFPEIDKSLNDLL